MKFRNTGAEKKISKISELTGKRAFSSRTVVGVICIVLALLITFGVAPLVNRYTDRKVDIVRLKTDVARGQLITAEQLEIVSVGAYNLPEHVLKDGNAIVGKYAATDLYAGDYLFASKLSTDNKSADDVLLGLNGDKVAVSVSIGNFAEGLSGKLENGDVVSIIIYDKEVDTSYIPAELKYVRVITTTTNDGIDKDENAGGGKAATVTLLGTPEQAELLAYYNTVTNIHFTLVYRGDSEQANKFVQAQDEYLAENPIEKIPTEAEAASNG